MHAMRAGHLRVHYGPEVKWTIEKMAEELRRRREIGHTPGCLCASRGSLSCKILRLFVAKKLGTKRLAEILKEG